MDTVGWVLRALEALRFAGEKEIQRWLDEEGETLSKLELSRALQVLENSGRIERKGDIYRLSNKGSSKAAFDKLFGD